jgi:hypothetical protein
VGRSIIVMSAASQPKKSDLLNFVFADILPTKTPRAQMINHFRTVAGMGEVFRVTAISADC